MRLVHLAVLAVLAVGLAGCGSGQKEDTLMPDVVGQRLDVALSDIERAGVEDKVEVLGGGLFGVIDESNWMVCDQLPAAGQVVTEAPRLTVDRTCDDDVPEQQESSQVESESEVSEVVDSEAIERAFKEHLRNNFIDDIGEMCDDAYTHWACFYDGVEDAPGYLRINLTTDGGWSDAALSDMADATGRHWFNFIGCDFPDLSTIVVRINGLDHNVFRWDTQADSLCS